MAMSGNGDVRKRYDIDLLSLTSSSDDGIRRNGDALCVEKPWAIAHLGAHRLQAGWWRLDCAGSNPDAVEVRLSSPQNPLVVVPARGNSARVYVGATEDHDVSLLVSPWPGRFVFSTLRLRRLGIGETAGLLFAAATRLLRRKNSLGLLARAVRRLLAGQAVGLSMPSDNPSRSVEPSPTKARNSVHPVAIQLVRDDAVVHLQSGDRLHREAIAIASASLAHDSALKAVFCDVVEGARILPHPKWDNDLAAMGAFDDAPVFVRAGISASNLSEIAERFGDAAIGRIPLPLVDRPTAMNVQARASVAPLLERVPRVSAIIPTKYRLDLLEKCLDGLIHRTGFPNLEVVIVDNGVTDPLFPALLDKVAKSLSLKVVEDKGPFNFSRLVNAGVRAAGGEIILLLNDDVEPIELGWLHRMVASAMAGPVGAVGARLLYPDRSVQHAGVVLGLGGTCAHLWRGLGAAAATENLYVTSTGGRMAVTGACLAVRRSEYDAVGGFDEVAFPVAYNDIDFCLRLHAKGLRNIYRGDASLVHHESQSRGSDEMSIATRKRQSAEAARFLQRWGHMIHSDPHFSPAFDPNVEIGVTHRANFAPSSDYFDV